MKLRIALLATLFTLELAGPAHSAEPSSSRVLVKFKGNVNERTRSDIRKHHRLSRSRPNVLGVEVLAVSTDDTPEEVVERLRVLERHRVELAEVDELIPPAFVPNDPQYPSQWHHALMGAPAAWDLATGEGVVTAICDSGVDGSNADLRLVPGWNVVSDSDDSSPVNWHGTSVAGTAAAIGNNGASSAGVAFGSAIMPLRVTNLTSGAAYFSHIATAINWAADHGAKTAVVAYQGAACSELIRTAADYMRDRGGIVVVAAGNSGAQIDCGHTSSLVVVSATDPLDHKPSWSTFGDLVDLAAPGESIVTTYGGGTASLSGTSFSAPIVAGVLGMIWDANPSLTPVEARSILIDTAADIGELGHDPFFGYGRPQANAAVERAMAFTPDNSAPTQPESLVVTEVVDTQLYRTHLRVTWAPATDDRRVHGYDVFRDGALLGSTPRLEYTDARPVVDATHEYRVQAWDGAGNLSPLSAPFAITAPPVTQIADVVVLDKTPTSVRIHFQTNVEATGYVNFGSNRKKGPDQTSATTPNGRVHDIILNGLSPATTYYYRAAAFSPSYGGIATEVTTFKTNRR
ncbi:MAG: S8 family serine peptidase [Deltaproteobacteria bacterium]|nr:S8 family serine peptidase [Deltaproteobacteria bacterium]